MKVISENNLFVIVNVKYKLIYFTETVVNRYAHKTMLLVFRILIFKADAYLKKLSHKQKLQKRY